MDDKSFLFSGTSISLSFFENTQKNLESCHRILKRYDFNYERKFGFQDLKEFDNYLEFRYIELIAKNIEISEKNKIVLKTIYLPKYIFIYLFENSSIFIGSTYFVRRIKNKLKNIINIEFRPKLKTKNQMKKLYNEFFKVFQLNLVDEDKDAYVKSFKIKGDLSEITNWEEFMSNNRYLSEVYGQLEINGIIYKIRIFSDCSCQIYKSGDSILKESIFWLKNYLFQI